MRARIVFLIILSFGIVVSNSSLIAQTDQRTADIERVLDLGEAYREVDRAFRRGEITRAELREQQQAIQQEGRAIRLKYGGPGNADRIAFDRDVTAGRTARDRANRRAVAAERQEQKSVQAQQTELAEAQRDTRPQLAQDIEAAQGYFRDFYDFADPNNPTQAELTQRASAGQSLAALLDQYRTGNRSTQRLEFEMALEAEYTRRFGATAAKSGMIIATYVPRPVVEFPAASEVLAWAEEQGESDGKTAAALEMLRDRLDPLIATAGYTDAHRESSVAHPVAEKWQGYVSALAPLGTADPIDETFEMAVLDRFAPNEANYSRYQEQLQQTARMAVLAKNVSIGLSVALIGLFVIGAIRRAMREKKQLYGFTETQEGNVITLAVQRGKFGIKMLIASYIFWFFLCFFIFLGAADLGIIPENPIVDAFGSYFFLLGVPVTALFFFNWLRSSKTIQVTDEDIIVGKNRYDIDHIRGLYVEIVGQTSEQIVSDNQFRYHGSHNRPAAAGSAIGSLVAIAAAPIRWAIRIDYGEQSRYLIKGLPERRADLVGDRLAELIQRRPEITAVESN